MANSVIAYQSLLGRTCAPVSTTVTEVLNIEELVVEMNYKVPGTFSSGIELEYTDSCPKCHFARLPSNIRYAITLFAIQFIFFQSTFSNTEFHALQNETIALVQIMGSFREKLTFREHSLTASSNLKYSICDLKQSFPAHQEDSFDISISWIRPL